MRHTNRRQNFMTILLLSVLVLSTISILSGKPLWANGKLSVLTISNKGLPKGVTVAAYMDQVEIQQLITGSWDIYFYHPRYETQVVGLLLLQNGTYTVEFFKSTEEEIRGALRTDLFILREPQGTFQCTKLDGESRQDLPFANEDMIADCFFTTTDTFERRMVIKLINVQGTLKLFLEHPV